MKKLLSIIFILYFFSAFALPSNKNGESIIVAYVTSWGSSLPDPTLVTHINYAFGRVHPAFTKVVISKPERLSQIVSLQERKPGLKVLLSIGGWGSGNFSEMAADSTLRKAFAADCNRVIKEYNLAGVDIDWEFPTSSVGKISSSLADTDNFTLLMRDIRKAIGSDKLLTIASHSTAGYVNFPAIEPYLDFVNIMSYDMDYAPKHNSPLYRSPMSGFIVGDEAVKAHLKVGVPKHKLVLGIPFYGTGTKEFKKYINYKDIVKIENYIRHWDDIAKMPYFTNNEGELVLSYEDAQSVGVKCNYILNEGLRGAMYWHYDGDDEKGTLRKAVYNGLRSK